MIWTLTSGETIFEISNGSDRTAQVSDRVRIAMEQITQETLLFRGSYPVAFPSRAARAQSFPIAVTFPPCASLAAAALEAITIPAQCPAGGVLTMQQDATEVTWSQAWVQSIVCDPLGITNQFTFTLRAVNPSTATLSTLAQMDSRYVANLSTLTGLTGGTATDLDGQTTTDVAVGFTAFFIATVAGVARPFHMRLIAGTTAENADPTAGPVVVRPDDYHASTNAKVWVEV